ncbi:hypothetical protein [Bacillus sp. WP8]|uniref:hypothetical protein n=1 Tax=Bacillus sp. WP8 TaxID=756828 RepID=UPI00164294BF|nr:hypothetical protein [Bacillus sp. WP8]
MIEGVELGKEKEVKRIGLRDGGDSRVCGLCDVEVWRWGWNEGGFWVSVVRNIDG